MLNTKISNNNLKAMNETKFVEAVIKLHDIARLVENEIGKGTLAEDLRKCADQLDLLTSIPREEVRK